MEDLYRAQRRAAPQVSSMFSVSSLTGLIAVVSLLTTAIATPTVLAANLCTAWQEPEKTGALEYKSIHEASGLAISRAFANRLYHHNDSGDGPNFYISAPDGSATQTVVIDNFTPIDVEAMALGPCPAGDTCLYLGDIGDNGRQRDEIKIVIIKEQETFDAQITPSRIVTVRYPDHPHDAEGLAMHPNGDLFIVTKEYDFADRQAQPAQLFKLTKDQLESDSTQELTHMGEIDLPYLLYEYGLRGRIVTGLDISSDGRKTLILTYDVALEAAVDLAEPIKPSREWKQDEDFAVISTIQLPQQEAIAYTAGGDAFLYTTEYHKKFGEAPIYQVACSKP